jgi:Protein of unknown function (DUF2911)
MLKNKIVHGLLTTVGIAGCLISCQPVNNKPVEIPKPFFEQANPYAAVDKSGMDVSYYPVNFPMLLMAGGSTDSLVARVIYSRPQKNGRKIFGNYPPPKNVQQYGTYWRLGANEATEIEFFKPVSINDQKIAKGRYSMYCLPYEHKWVVVLNTSLYSWGLHADSTKDIAKIEIPAATTDKNAEYFTMVFEPSAGGANLIMAWDDVKAVLPITFR